MNVQSLIIGIGLLRLKLITKGELLSKTTVELIRALYKQVLAGQLASQYGHPVALYNKHLARLAYKLSKLDDDNCADSNFPDSQNYVDDCLTFFNATLHHRTEKESQVLCQDFVKKVFRDNIVEARVELETDARREEPDRLASNGTQPKSSVKDDSATLTTLTNEEKTVQVVCEIKTEEEQDTHMQTMKSSI